MTKETTKCFNSWADKILRESKTVAEAIEQLKWCYYKYNGYKESEDVTEVIDVLDYENLEQFADRLQYECGLENETIQDTWTYIVTSELIAEHREA